MAITNGVDGQTKGRVPTAPPAPAPASYSTVFDREKLRKRAKLMGPQPVSPVTAEQLAVYGQNMQVPWWQVQQPTPAQSPVTAQQVAAFGQNMQVPWTQVQTPSTIGPNNNPYINPWGTPVYGSPNPYNAQPQQQPRARTATPAPAVAPVAPVADAVPMNMSPYGLPWGTSYGPTGIPNARREGAFTQAMTAPSSYGSSGTKTWWNGGGGGGGGKGSAYDAWVNAMARWNID